MDYIHISDFIQSSVMEDAIRAHILKLEKLVKLDDEDKSLYQQELQALQPLEIEAFLVNKRFARKLDK